MKIYDDNFCAIYSNKLIYVYVPVAQKMYDINTGFQLSLSGHLQCHTNYNINP